MIRMCNQIVYIICKMKDGSRFVRYMMNRVEDIVFPVKRVLNPNKS